MSLLTRIVARLADLPPAPLQRVGVQRDLRVTMPDRVALLADRFYPLDEGTTGNRAPIILMRTPYGRRQSGDLFGRIFAERGYQVVAQSVRGTFGSGGEFNAFRNEERDGRATLAWLAEQPWFSGVVGMMGASYVGFTQWSLANDAPPWLRAMVPHITASQFRSLSYPGETFDLGTALNWIDLVHIQETARPWQMLLGRQRHLAPAYATTPLDQADKAATGETVSFYQDWLTHNIPGDPFWEAINFGRQMNEITPAMQLIAGWHDIFLPYQLADYQALRQVGKRPYLTIGPWVHTSIASQAVALKEGLAWLDAHLRDDRSHLRASPVRIFVMGANEWRELPDWPPAATPTRWYLQPAGALAPDTPAATADAAPPDTYRYDPANPTPAIGGIFLGPGSGPQDNRPLESRPDVLTYTGAPLTQDLEIIGPVQAAVYFASSAPSADVFVRLCDVAPNGRSWTVCDGIRRITPDAPDAPDAADAADAFPPDDDGVRRVTVEMWPTAYRFARGHRVRLLVASGAHPVYARNPGSGEPLGTATTFVVAEQRVYHDAARPSCVTLPVVVSGAS